ncbi:MAG: PIG-L family deacetylase [candidate division KSB1 bacterium]|nr:PIG-L family deacetylase [candidate division KSB1 bacterium]
MRTLTSLVMLILLIGAVSAQQAAGGKLSVIVFGAHPDDCELKVGGIAARWAAAGHRVKFVSVTNGDIGHATQAGGPLARRRTAEVKKAAEILGIESEVLDIHDGELMPTLENRREFVRLIREWQADIVIGHRPNDYHPDHRYVGVLMQDAAFMVTVAHFEPLTPQLARNPIFLYMSDNFQKPNPFEPDIVVAVDDVFEQKVQAVWQLESQIESLWATGNFEKVVPIPTDPDGRAARFKWLFERQAGRDGGIANKYRDKLIELYGPEAGARIKYAEAFELCEYGRQPSREELKSLFMIKTP